MDPDFWLRQWEAFAKAPVACLIFLALGLVAAWWFRGSVDQGETRGLLAQIAVLKEQINAFEQRFKLAGEQEQSAVKARQSAQDELAALKAQSEKARQDMLADSQAASEKARQEFQAARDKAIANLQQALHETEQAQERLAGTLRPSGGQHPFTVGGRVFHQKFGYGWIRGVDGERIAIQFYVSGDKRIIAKYLEHA